MMQVAKQLGVILLTAVALIAPESYQLISQMEARSQTEASPHGTMLVADATPADKPSSFDINSILGILIEKLGPLGILAWYLYRTSTVTLPGKDEELINERERGRQEAQKQRDDHKDVVNGILMRVDKQTEAMMLMVQHCSGKGG